MTDFAQVKLPVIARWDVIVSQGRAAFGVSVETEKEAYKLASFQRGRGRMAEIIPIEIDTFESGMAAFDQFFDEEEKQ